MVKMGPVGEYEFKLNSQEIIPENETELNNIIKGCLKIKCLFFVDIFEKPIEVTTTIGKIKFKARWCVLVHKDVADDIFDYAINPELLED